MNGALAACTPTGGLEPIPRDPQDPARQPRAEQSGACRPAAADRHLAQIDRHVARLQVLRDPIRARRAAGSGSATDLAQVEAQLAGARARRARAQADLAIARASLAKLRESRASTSRRPKTFVCPFARTMYPHGPFAGLWALGDSSSRKRFPPIRLPTPGRQPIPRSRAAGAPRPRHPRGRGVLLSGR
ncbi:TolC family protein [Rhodovibrio sodomensis]|uniref:TolC family protein n=1 Tax=Rhodovibrio sodomensis TaxID=1088 RepID=UPI003460B11C